MKILLPATVIAAMVLSVSSGECQEQSPPSTDAVCQAISTYWVKINDCLKSMAATGTGKKDKADAAFSASFLLESYARFAANLSSNDALRLTQDPELAAGLCALHVACAEHQLNDAALDSNPPYATALENALAEYRFACTGLDAIKDPAVATQLISRIKDGLQKTIAGLNKYANWFAGDVFMNAAGKPWEANPAPQAQTLLAQLDMKQKPMTETAICEKAIDDVISNIHIAVEKRQGAIVMDNMLLGARWLTTILRKYPDIFTRNFARFDATTKEALDAAAGGYAPEGLVEFKRFYEPLRSYYLKMKLEESKK